MCIKCKPLLLNLIEIRSVFLKMKGVTSPLYVNFIHSVQMTNKNDKQIY
jgi:hypothetical protein